MSKNIYLVGMPSSGKSTIGRPLAQHLGYTFVDLDTVIEEQEKMDIPSLFRLKGETYFREIERQVLRTFPKNNKLLIATGGGTPCFFDSMDYILDSGIAIFLDVPPAELARRISQHGKDDRPLLSGVSSLEHELEKKLGERIPYYSRAHIQIAVTTDVTQIVKTLSRNITQLAVS